jgi:hypothetical protein
MNLQEFAALKAGDKIDNAMAQSQGEVTEATAHGVRVRWGVPTGGRDSVTFQYTVQSTAWFHWSRIVEAIETREDGIA